MLTTSFSWWVAALLSTPTDPCAGRSGCRVAEERPAGRDASGRTLTVARLALDPRDLEVEPPGADLEKCVPYEWWLRAGADSRPLVRVCNDGYGAAGVGEDAVEVGDNRLEYTQAGGSNWRWSTTTVLMLSPPRLLATASDGAWTLGTHEERQRWDRTTWTGSVSWAAPPCGEDDAAEITPRQFEYRWLPAPPLPAPWRSGGWREIGLGTCAAEAAFTIHGAPGVPGDTRLRAVLGPEGELFVEIEDDAWQRGAARWLHDDHVEVWTGEPASYTDACVEAGEPPVQWAIGVLDPWIHQAHGAPVKTPPSVERHVVGGRARLKIRLPAAPRAVTVVYSDSDDGRTQERLVATSALKHGDRATLGRPRVIAADDAVCEAGARLDFQDRWAPPGRGPILGEPGDLTGLAALGWLAGAWRGDGGEEVWLAPAGGLMVGMARALEASGGATFEYLRLEERDGEVSYVAQPGGRPPSRFKMTSQGASEAVFEDPQHDFPRRIAYRREGDTLRVQLTGVEAGQPRTLDLTWRLSPLVP